MAKKIRWGILGTGSIAHKFAKGLSVLQDAQLTAVGSRSQQKAEAFGDEYDVLDRHASYAALVDDAKVDVIYIATPHSLHCENTLLCLKAGKAVLCEKPFAINVAQATTMVDKAKASRLFLMEAMWTRYFPLMVELRRMLSAGFIGELRMVAADFGFRAGLNPQARLFNPALGGGALLDVGIYTVSLDSMILGTPTQITACAHLGETGVDEQAGIILGHRNGQLSVLYTAIRTHTPQEATIMGTEGSIRIHSPWWVPQKMTLNLAGKSPEVLEFPIVGNGYNYQAAEVMRCLREAKLESDVMPLTETISVMQTLDKIRSQWGLKYPMESEKRNGTP